MTSPLGGEFSFSHCYEDEKDSYRKWYGSDKTKFVDSPDEIKRSTEIIKLVEPYIRMYWGNEMRIRGMISLATTKWNMTFLPEEEQTELREKSIKEILPKDCDAQNMAVILDFFKNLQERQRELFPNIRTFIIGHDLSIDSENIYLNISSLPLNE